MKIISRMKKSDVLHDFILNFIASFVTVGVTQLLLYPWLSQVMGAEEYGIVLTIMGVANTITATIGGSLNNVRLIKEADYEDNEIRGDFLPLICIGSIVGMLVMSVYLIMQKQDESIIIIGMSVFIFLASVRNYGSVYFRLILNYKKIMVTSLLIAGGNLVGLVVLLFNGNSQWWFLVFLIGEITGVVYLLRNSKLTKESFQFTWHIKSIMRVEIVLLISTLIGNLLIYLDRILLLPILGGEAVSLYTVASFLGKSFGVILNPLSGVLLSYYAQKSYVMNQKKFWGINLMIFMIAIPFFFLCVVISEPITGIFYPTLIKDASTYLVAANAAAIINTLASMTQPAVLKYADISWQMVIQLIYAVVYLGIGYVGTILDGLRGFTVAAIIAAVTRLVMLYIIGHVSLNKLSVPEI